MAKRAWLLAKHVQMKDRHVIQFQDQGTVEWDIFSSSFKPYFEQKHLIKKIDE